MVFDLSGIEVVGLEVGRLSPLIPAQNRINRSDLH